MLHTNTERAPLFVIVKAVKQGPDNGFFTLVIPLSMKLKSHWVHRDTALKPTRTLTQLCFVLNMYMYRAGIDQASQLSYHTFLPCPRTTEPYIFKLLS